MSQPLALKNQTEQHHFILTHRKDMPDATLRVIEGDGATLVHMHPVQSVQGRIMAIHETALDMEHPVFGKVKVETHLPLLDSKHNRKQAEKLSVGSGKMVVMALNDTGNAIAIAQADPDPAILLKFDGPAKVFDGIPEKALGTEIEQERRFVLTHRTDLKERVVRRQFMEGPIDTHYIPIQSITGRITKIDASSIRMDNTPFGRIELETNKQLFMDKENRAQKGLIVEGSFARITAATNGKRLVIQQEHTPLVVLDFNSPFVPYGLLPIENLSRPKNAEKTAAVCKTVEGILTHVHNRSTLELKTDKQSILIQADKSLYAECVLQKHIGKAVQVRLNDRGQMQVDAVRERNSAERCL